MTLMAIGTGDDLLYSSSKANSAEDILIGIADFIESQFFLM